jgi:hypothetical protein
MVSCDRLCISHVGYVSMRTSAGLREGDFVDYDGSAKLLIKTLLPSRKNVILRFKIY